MRVNVSEQMKHYKVGSSGNLAARLSSEGWADGSAVQRSMLVLGSWEATLGGSQQPATPLQQTSSLLASMGTSTYHIQYSHMHIQNMHAYPHLHITHLDNIS